MIGYPGRKNRKISKDSVRLRPFSLPADTMQFENGISTLRGQELLKYLKSKYNVKK